MIQLFIAIDFRLSNGKLIGREERIESIPDHTMFASWYATTQPLGYRSVCGGLVYVRDSDIFRIEVSDDKSPIEVDEGYVWSDTNNPDGVMFAIVLPVDHSLADPVPSPYEAKNFQGRVAVHWRIPPPDGPTFEVSWRLRELSEGIDVEVKRINNVIFNARRGGETPKYDVALSYASEDKEYVDELAAALKQMGVTYFYDRDEDQAVNLWGRNLYQYLAEVYSKRARYTVIFISSYYSKKRWTSHELQSAQARAFVENREYILPARFDETELPGLLPVVAYVSLKSISPVQLAQMIRKKVESTRI